MHAAIAQLEETLRTLTENELINRLEDKIDQAELEARNASEIRWALSVLKAVNSGPIWLGPKTT